MCLVLSLLCGSVCLLSVCALYGCLSQQLRVGQLQLRLRQCNEIAQWQNMTQATGTICVNSTSLQRSSELNGEIENNR